MNKKDLEKEIKKIDAELKTHEEIIKLVSELKKKKSKLKEELDSLEMEELPFNKQFEKWLKSSKGGKDTWIPDRKVYPNLRKIMDSFEFNRYETVSVKDDYPFYDLWDFVINEDKEGAEEEIKDYKVLVKAAKEVMENNLGSFKYDW